MAQWKKTVDIKEVIHNEDLAESEKPKLIADILKKSGEPDLVDLGEELEEFSGINYDEEEVNFILQEVYEYADFARIWMGG